MVKLAIWMAFAPLALLVFPLVWRNLAALPSSLTKESVGAAPEVADQRKLLSNLRLGGIR